MNDVFLIECQRGSISLVALVRQLTAFVIESHNDYPDDVLEPETDRIVLDNLLPIGIANEELIE